MAKKAKKYSHVIATNELEKLGNQGISAQDFVYELLRIFAEYGEGQIGRLKDGRGNLAKDDITVLVKNLIAYRPVHKHDSEALYDTVKAMLSDPKIVKQNPRLFVASDGKRVVVYDPKDKDWNDNSLDTLWKSFEFLTPLAGIEKIQPTEEAEADVKSAELMAKLFDDIRHTMTFGIRRPSTPSMCSCRGCSSVSSQKIPISSLERIYLHELSKAIHQRMVLTLPILLTGPSSLCRRMILLC